MIRRHFGGALERVDDIRRGRQIGIADTEADHVNSLLLDFFFEAVELGEQVWRQEAQASGGFNLHRSGRLRN